MLHAANSDLVLSKLAHSYIKLTVALGCTEAIGKNNSCEFLSPQNIFASFSSFLIQSHQNSFRPENECWELEKSTQKIFPTQCSSTHSKPQGTRTVSFGQYIFLQFLVYQERAKNLSCYKCDTCAPKKRYNSANTTRKLATRTKK